MRVRLSEELFEESNPDPVGLLGLFSLARSGRHRMLLYPSFRRDDDRDLARNRWLMERSQNEREQLSTLLEVSARDASADRPETLEITVIAGAASRWNDPLELSLQDADVFLRKPLLLQLEDHKNDWLFLRVICPPQLREELDHARWCPRDCSGSPARR